METKIKIDHLKCDGCAATIKKSLFKIKGIEAVIILPDTEEVFISYKDHLSLKLAKDELRRLGYPETGTTQGIEKITGNIRSYISCAVGKISKSKTD
jgi:copper chaperone